MAIAECEQKSIIQELKESRPVNYATLGVLGLVTFYEATAFGGDISNTAALGVLTGAQLNRVLRRNKIKI